MIPRRQAGAEPGMLVEVVVDHQLNDDADTAAMRLLDEELHVLERAYSA